MRYVLYISFLVAAEIASAQKTPQMTWEGYVSGSATLYIQGERVDSQGRDTGSIDRPRYKFHSPLPAARQEVTVEVRKGRGKVEIVEQPVPENEYSAVVRVDPTSSGPEYFVLDLHWDGNRAQTRARTGDPSMSGEMTWSGDVDEEVLVKVSDRRAVAHAVRGRDVKGDVASFSRALPQKATVELANAEGRGRIRLVPQQTADTAVVHILDPQGGAGRYSFRLSWSDAGNSGQGGALTSAGFRWSGRVDGQVRVTLRGDQASSTTVSGGVIQDEQSSVGTALPRIEANNVEVRKLQGRGTVKVVQQPSPQNGYALVIEIEDTLAGADDYAIEVTWR